MADEKSLQWKTLYFGIDEAERQRLGKAPLRVEARLCNAAIPQPFTGNFNIIHDTVILHTFRDPPRIIEIRDETLLAMFRNYFDILWQGAMPIAL